jgi:hypothetical protein
MHAKDLLQLIAEDKLRVLAVETKVDHYAKKLDGLVMFQLILFSFLNRKRVPCESWKSFFVQPVSATCPIMPILMQSTILSRKEFP